MTRRSIGAGCDEFRACECGLRDTDLRVSIDGYTESVQCSNGRQNKLPAEGRLSHVSSIGRY